MYVDHYHESLFDWIHPDLEDDVVSIDDVDSILEYGEKCEHEDDEQRVVIQCNC